MVSSDFNNLYLNREQKIKGKRVLFCHHCRATSDLATNYVCKKCQSRLRVKRGSDWLNVFEKEVRIK